jgi:Lysyl oxidase
VKPQIVDNFFFAPDSCAIDEGCILASGWRRILRFNTDVVNQGNANLRFQSVPARRPDVFEWAQCHGHYHFDGFSRFALVKGDKINEVVVDGLKRSYCAEDTRPFWPAHPKMSCLARTDCDHQGISIGWIDTYPAALDCQFLDITNVAPGNYSVYQCVNPDSAIAEKTLENNCVITPIYIPPRVPL